jgi:integrase
MPSLISKRGKKRWRATVMVNGTRKDKLFPDKSKNSYRQAVLWEKEVTEQLEKEPIAMDCLTMLDWAEEYLDFAENNFSLKTYGEKKRAFASFFKYVDADSGPEVMTPGVAMKYLMKESKIRSGNAANKDRKNLAAGWEWGRKYINRFPQDPLNPFKAVQKFPEKRSPRYVPPEKDFWKIYHQAEGQDQIMLLTYLHLAARRKEVFNLTWEDLDFGNGQIRIWTSKRKDGTKEFDWLPMTSELKKALMGWWEKRPLKDSPYVFLCLNREHYCEPYFGKPFKERRHFMKTLCEKAEVKPFGFHAIRHLTASILYHKGYDVSVIQSILRHKSPTTTNGYLRSLGLEATREALESGLVGPGSIIPFPQNKKASGDQS